MISLPHFPAPCCRIGPRIRRLPWIRRIPPKKTPDPLHFNVPGLQVAVLVSAKADAAPPEILAGVARAEPQAMERCIENFGPLVWTIVSRRVRDRGAAEDLTQEIFTEVWKMAGRFNPLLGSETTFIGMIARRRAIDWCRSRRGLPELEGISAAAGLPDLTRPPGEAMDGEALWRTLDHLPAETRRLFALHFEQGMTHGEISETTGLPLGSVKTRLRRGLIEARRLLGKFGAVQPSKMLQ